METVIKFNNWIIELILTISLRATAISYMSSNPLVICLILIMLALIVGRISGIIYMKWIIYAIILIFLGGIMVVFIYVTRLAGNEKFILKPTLLLVWTSVIFFIRSSFINLASQTKKENFMSHLFITSSSFILWRLTIFLLITLIIVVKITENFKGALIKFI